MPSSIEVSTGFENCVRIVPMAGKIEYVSRIGQGKEGTLVTLTPEFIKIELENILYQINLDSSITA